MKTAHIHIEGISPLSQSQAIRSERDSQEQHSKFEERTWRERINADENGIAYIPAMAFKNCLTDVAKYLSLKVPGKRNATYTKHFASGIIVDENVSLGTKAEEVAGEWRFVPSDGKVGGGSRVWKCFPVWPVWSGNLTVHVVDDIITKEAFEEHMQKAGLFIGIGRFRPQKNGFYGRFQVKSIKWS